MSDSTKHWHRPFISKTISELVQTFNEQCLAAGSCGTAGGVWTADDHPDAPEEERLPASFLKSPASQGAINELEGQVVEDFPDGLPEDLKEFFKATNGIYPHDNADCCQEIIRPLQAVEYIDLDEYGLELELEPLPFELTMQTAEFQWPSIKTGIQLGAGGDEGVQVLVPPAIVREAVMIFNEVYDSADKDTKEKLECAVREFYGEKGIEALRNVVCPVLRTYHWSGKLEMFLSLKHLMEDYVKAMEDAKVRKEDKNRGKVDEENKEKEHNVPRKTIPEGEPNSLKGLKLLFTGTFDTMDRATSKSTAQKYGAEVITKLENTDYVVLGIAPGPKKLEIIKANGLETINEDGFFELLQGREPNDIQDSLEEPDANSVKTFASRNGASSAGNQKKHVPEGKVNSLEGLKILFTGTLETMDRGTAKTAAEKHGAKVTTKLDDTDFIILGVKAGPKKLEEIEQKGLKTVTETEFNEMIQTGDTGVDGSTEPPMKRMKAAA